MDTHELLQCMARTGQCCMQDTLRSKPSERSQMRKAISSSWIIFTSLYMCVGCLGYSAFGDKTPINLLTKTGVYGFFNPYWLIDAGNMFVMLRMVGAYQVSTFLYLCF